MFNSHRKWNLLDLPGLDPQAGKPPDPSARKTVECLCAALFATSDLSAAFQVGNYVFLNDSLTELPDRCREWLVVRRSDGLEVESVTADGPLFYVLAEILKGDRDDSDWARWSVRQGPPHRLVDLVNGLDERSAA